MDMRNPLVLSLFYGGASAFLSACGGSPPTEAASSEPPSTATSATTEATAEETAPPPAARYTVHEWGLVDVAADGSVELAAGPGQANLAAPRPPQPHPVVTPDTGWGTARKPVLYFHLVEGEVQVSVSATMTFGSMLERFPATAMNGPDLRWDQVRIVGRACGAHTYPTVGSAGCEGIADNYCEAAELAAYEASDASCLVVDGRDYNHLFYRGGGRGMSVPITVTRSGGDLTIHNASAFAIPLALSVSTDTGSRRDRRAAPPAVTIRRFGRIPAGTSTEFHEAIPVDQALTMVRAELGLLGLTGPEIQAFMNAWEQAVFRAPNVGTSVIYLLPPELVDAVSTLSLTPEPEATRRAMMVRVEI
jgi:hypothetical protein